MVLETRNKYGFLRSKAAFQIYLMIIFSISFFVVNAETVSAQEVGCCENNGQGSYCLPTTQENCDPNSQWSPVSCEFTSFCSTGCCVDGLDGSCSNGVPQAACENAQNTAFHDGVSCDTISYCQRGCCELGNSFIFNTEQSCQRLIDEYYPTLNIEQTWNDKITDEYTCISQSIQDDEGSVDCEDTSDFPNNVHDPAMGGPRINGESWCVRQAKVGVGYDLPGSRHYKYSCVYGEELVEPCNEFREDVCFQLIPNETNSGSIASCIVNEGAQCVSECNKKPLDKKRSQNRVCCDQYESCLWAEGSCIPNVPPGYAFDDKFVQQAPEYDAKEQCNVGNMECKSVWSKGWNFGYKCVRNCHCTEFGWVDDANDYCRTLGDCGAWYNLVGDFTDKGQRTGGSGETKSLRVGNYMVKYPFSEIIEGGEHLTGIYPGFKTTLEGLYWYESELSWKEFGLISGVAAAGILFTIPVAGWIAAAVLAAYMLVKWIFGIGKTKTKIHKFTCAPWQAPTRSNDCERCSDLAPDGVCYESLCRSLGKNCELINGEDPYYAECISGSINDIIPPKITPWAELIHNQNDKFGVGYDFDVVAGSAGGYVIKPDVDPLIPFTFGVQTNEPAQCRYDTELNTAGYYEMTHEFDQGSLLVKDHNFTLTLPGNQDYDFYVRCVDFYDNGENDPPFLIKFSTKNEPDHQPPIILATDPLSGSSVAYDINQTPVILYLNEPVETCRWSNQNVPFEQMSLNNSFFCGCDAGELNACTGTSPSGGGELCDYLDENGLFVYDDFECVGLLEGIQPEQENSFFISCVDIEKNDGTGCNYFPSSYEYNLMGSSELEIIGMEPENGTYYYPTFDLRITTSGGADNGNAVCYYDGVEFFSTGGNTHVQQQNRTAGTYEYSIFCEDIALNTAEGAMSITVDVNTYPPVVENLYSQNGMLYLITDEPSTCEYSVDNQYFSIGNGFEMSGVMVKEHSLTFVEDVYYIKCYDAFMNVGDTITVYNGA